jgi:hypothetical protein
VPYYNHRTVSEPLDQLDRVSHVAAIVADRSVVRAPLAAAVVGDHTVAGGEVVQS